MAANQEMPKSNRRRPQSDFVNTQLDLFATQQGIAPPPRVRVVYTSALRQRLSAEYERMILRSLREFAELDGATITIGYTRRHLGVAIRDNMTIRLNPRHPSYNTIGHELTHLLQGPGKIPGGEVQCDIWTLARSPLFLDEPPTYLVIDTKIRDNWPRYALRVRELCRAAIDQRTTHRLYIQWLRRELKILARA